MLESTGPPSAVDPLDTTTGVGLGHANAELRRKIEPVLQRILRAHGMLK